MRADIQRRAGGDQGIPRKVGLQAQEQLGLGGARLRSALGGAGATAVSCIVSAATPRDGRRSPEPPAASRIVPRKTTKTQGVRGRCRTGSSPGLSQLSRKREKHGARVTRSSLATSVGPTRGDTYARYHRFPNMELAIHRVNHRSMEVQLRPRLSLSKAWLWTSLAMA